MPEAPETKERPYHHGDLRRTILETAMAMLGEDSGWAFTLREVARRAGVSHAAPYKHFADKSALLAEIALIGFDRLRGRIAAELSKEAANFVSRFEAVGQTYLSFGRENPALYRLMFGGELGRNAGVHLDPRTLGAYDLVIGLLEEGQKAGQVRKRPVRGQAAACWAQLHGMVMLDLDGLLIPEKTGGDPFAAGIETLLEGLEP